jgi:small-conductance mechanosensitive channel
VRRSDLVLLLVVYVIPVGVAAVLLTLADLGILAVALVIIEAIVATTVYVARQRPEQPAVPSKRPWLVPASMIGALGLMVVVAIIASQAG